MVDLVQAHRGLGSDVLADVFLPDGSAEAKAHSRGCSATPAPTVALAAGAVATSSRSRACWTRSPHPRWCCTGAATGRFPYRLGRDLAARIPGARLVSPAGVATLPYAGDAAAVIGAILAFLELSAGKPRPRRPSGRRARSPPGSSRSPRWSPRADQRQIAERLGIQERSAEGHLERIRQRLGVSSRAQVAAWWRRRADARRYRVEVPAGVFPA